MSRPSWRGVRRRRRMNRGTLVILSEEREFSHSSSHKQLRRASHATQLVSCYCGLSARLIWWIDFSRDVWWTLGSWSSIMLLYVHFSFFSSQKNYEEPFNNKSSWPDWSNSKELLFWSCGLGWYHVAHVTNAARSIYSNLKNKQVYNVPLLSTCPPGWFTNMLHFFHSSMDLLQSCSFLVRCCFVSYSPAWKITTLK